MSNPQKSKSELKQLYSIAGGVVLFKCGCVISSSNLILSRIGSQYQCLVHNQFIDYVFKRCKICGAFIQYKSITQIMKREFCSIECVKIAQERQRQEYETTPPLRNYDCFFYDNCMAKACTTNKIDIGCSTCNEYLKDLEFGLK